MAERIRVLLVDDEPLARLGLRGLVARHPDLELCGECDDGVAALEAVRKLRPDALFLDIQMPEVDGFALLDQLGAAPLPAVVFVTAHDAHAVRAFEVRALDYLLKPVAEERFDAAVERVRERLGRIGSGRQAERLVSVEGGRTVRVAVEEIDWIEAQDYCVLLHVGERAHLLRKSLATLERELDPAHFARVHRSAIVNLRRVKEVHRTSTGATLVLASGATLAISRRRRRELGRRLG